MRKLALQVIVAVVSVTDGASTAAAEWMYQAGLHDPFKGGAEQIAAYVESQVVTPRRFGFRCHTAADLQVMWTTGERVGGAERASVERARFRIALIVDGRPAIYTRAEPGVLEMAQLGLVSTDRSSAARFAMAIAAAEREIAVAGEMGGKIIFSEPLPVEDAADSVRQLVDACKITVAPVGEKKSNKSKDR